MQKPFTNQSLEAFTSELASKSPIPGGGGTAALCGALAAALCSMAGNLTLGKKKYAAFDDDNNRMIEKAESLRKQFLDLIEADAKAFAPLSRVYSLPKDTQGYDEIMTQVTLNACQAPYHMMECCGDVVLLLEEMLQKCSRLMISDVGCGAACAQAALEAAYMNVLINTRSLPDNAEAQQLERSCDTLRNDLLSRTQNLTASVMVQLRRK